MNVCVKFGIILRKYRENKNYTREYLAESCDIDTGLLPKLKNGDDIIM